MSKKTKKTEKKAKFELSPFKSTGIRYNKKDMYSAKVTTYNTKYQDMYKYVDEQRKKLLKKYPEGMMNIAIKYNSQSKPISAGYSSIADLPDLKAPYDYQDEDDPIESFYIQFTM